MTDDSTFPSFGNARIDAAAQRLNQAFLKLEQKRYESAAPADGRHEEINLLEQENMRLHEELAGLKQLLNELDAQLADTEQQLNAFMENHA